jgi:hypothetical protein
VSQKTAVSRQETFDAMEGIIDDDNGDLDRSRRREFMQAFDTDRSTCLGARHVIAFDSKRFDGTGADASSIEFYYTQAQAMQALEQILETMQMQQIQIQMHRCAKRIAGTGAVDACRRTRASLAPSYATRRAGATFGQTQCGTEERQQWELTKASRWSSCSICGAAQWQISEIVATVAGAA